eukprot:TRINITY_DN830_c0_g2_i1.p1 TRINITY_DN830_c0_g2~~TRINITY_DN830_c0_g2_i1.p1  ORF type:complete len:164 (-),score=44.12 TRINITY_DN830_c0_g2_i1:15-506(-)
MTKVKKRKKPKPPNKDSPPSPPSPPPTISKDVQHTEQTVILVLISIVSVLILLILANLLIPRESDKDYIDVPIVQWDQELPFITDAIARGEPVVLKNTSILTWSAFSNWTPDYLAQNVKSLKGVYRCESNIFGPYYDPSKPLASADTEKRKAKYCLHSMPNVN